jgi:hypothetical protein
MTRHRSRFEGLEHITPGITQGKAACTHCAIPAPIESEVEKRPPAMPTMYLTTNEGLVRALFGESDIYERIVRVLAVERAAAARYELLARSKRNRGLSAQLTAYWSAHSVEHHHGWVEQCGLPSCVLRSATDRRQRLIVVDEDVADALNADAVVDDQRGGALTRSSAKLRRRECIGADPAPGQH